jgi:hypothetical protein
MIIYIYMIITNQKYFENIHFVFKTMEDETDKSFNSSLFFVFIKFENLRMFGRFQYTGLRHFLLRAVYRLHLKKEMKFIF